MPVAKEVLRIGFTVVALPGGFVTDEAVKEYGWEKLVESDSGYKGPTDAEETTTTTTGRTRKTAAS